MTTRWKASRERNDAHVAAHAQRVLNDRRWDPLRTGRARTTIVITQLVLIALVPVAWITVGSIAGLAAVLAAIGVLWALRRSVRVLADLPDDVLDERQRALRDATYVEAYRWLAAAIVVAVSVGMVAFVIAADDDAWAVTLTWNHAMATFWTVWLLAMALPSVAMARRDRAEPVIDPDA